jgi:hypothetical protein
MSGFAPSLAEHYSNRPVFGDQATAHHLFLGNEEPPLGEVLVDPLVHLLMERDGVRMTTLLLLIGETQTRLG